MHRFIVSLFSFLFLIVSLFSSAQTLQWQPLNESPYEEPVFHVTTGNSNGEWYIANSYFGVWRTLDDGKHWERIMNEYAPDIRGIAIDPANSQHIYVASGQWGIWWTTNGGSTWYNETFTLQGTGSTCGAVAISPTNPHLIFAGNNRSTNNFQSWQQMPEIDPNSLMDYAFLSDGTAFASENYFGIVTVRKSVNDGQTWSDVGVFASNGLVRMAVDSNDNLYLAANIGSTTPAVYKTIDNGVTWTPHALPAVNQNSTIVRDLAYHKASNTLYALVSDTWAVGPGFIYKSTDGGNNWAEVNRPNLNLGLSGIAVSDDQKLMLPSNTYDHSVQLFESNTWKARARNLTSDLIDDLIFYEPKSVAIDGSEFIATSQGGGVYQSVEKGDSLWVPRSGFIHKRKSTFQVSIHPRSSDLLAATVAGGYRSDDFGKTWILETGNLIDTNSNTLISRFLADTLGNYYALIQPNSSLANDLGIALCRSADNGITWDTILLANPLIGGIKHLLIDEGGHIFSSSGWMMLRSLDQGTTWDTINNNLPNLVAEYFQDRNGKLYYLHNGWQEVEIYCTTDLGDNWVMAGEQILPAGSHIQFARIFFDQNNDLWMVHNSDSSIFYSPNIGQTWQTKAKGFPFRADENWMEGLAFDDENTPYGFDIWGQMYKYSEKVNTPTGFEKLEYIELQVWPNPATDRLEVQLPKELIGQEVEFLIADISGRVLEKSRYKSISQLAIDVGKYAPGSYLLVARFGHKQWIAKWIKSK